MMSSRGETPIKCSWGAAVALALGLVSCDGAPSATPARSHAANEGGSGPSWSHDDSGVQQASYGSAPRADSRSDSGGSYADRAERAEAKPDLDAEAPRYHGKPIWAANRNHSSQDNADYQFKKNGADLGADTEDAFIAKAHDFVDHPPQGAQTLKRSNGDTLIYDAKDNLFAVVAKDGAPRTLFKPRDGATYWDQQKADLDKPYSGYRTSARRSSGADDNG